MTARPARRGAAFRTMVISAGLLAGVSACTVAPPPHLAAPPDPVPLTATVPEQLSIGVVVTLSSAPGEGVEWRDAAAGAIVAGRRFALGGTAVTIVPANDKGTAAGATAAVRTLVDSGVAGIVLASSGDHLRGALAEAEREGVAVLLPYAETTDELPEHGWVTGPEPQTADARLVQALANREVTEPFLVDAGGGPVAGLTASGTRSFAATDDAAALAKALRARQQRPADRFDSVVVAGPAERQAAVVQALQGVDVDVPVFLTSSALSPAFPAALGKFEGSLSGDFVSVGLDDGDAAALQGSSGGRSLAAYFAALRTAASDPSLQDFFGERPFSAVAGAADVRSHDAVVALVRAAAATKSTDVDAVAQGLSGLKLTAEDGVAGAPLDFSTPAAVPADAVVALAATAIAPGVRPAPIAGAPALYWFALPTP